jgi:hypothetical protein
MFGTATVIQHIQSSGMNSFKFSSPWPHTDHRGLFIDIDILGILGATLHDIPKSPLRQVTSKSKKIINSFITNIHKMKQITNLLTQLILIQDVPHWTVNEYSLLQQIDQQFTTILLESEKKCAIPTLHHCSVELHKKYLSNEYWVTYLRGKNNINVEIQL